MSRRKKRLPFTVSRNDGRKLVVQVADGLKNAIARGYYKPGDTLPASRELAPMLGVSRIVTAAALRRLADEGWVDARPRIGSVVRDRSAKRWRGRVVMAFPDGYDNYLQTVLTAELRETLLHEGYLFEEAIVKRAAGGYDFSNIEVALSQSADLAVSMYARKEIMDFFAGRGVPYAICGEVSRKPLRAVGVTRIDFNKAVPDFVAACGAAGVKRVIEVSWFAGMCGVVGALKKAGIAAQKMRIDVDTSKGRFFAVRKAGMDTFARLIASGRLSRESLYFFSDDYLASGALAALSYAGFKSPQDIRIATWANAGLGPVYPRELSRMEFDPVGTAKEVSAAVTAYLKTGVYPSSVVGAKWFAGETMAAPNRSNMIFRRGRKQ